MEIRNARDLAQPVLLSCCLSFDWRPVFELAVLNISLTQCLVPSCNLTQVPFTLLPVKYSKTAQL